MAKVEYSETYTEIYHSIGFQRSFSRTLKIEGEKDELLELIPKAFRSLPKFDVPVLDARNEVLGKLLSDFKRESLSLEE